jgi:uncharacterized protein (TIGR02444 family)
MQCADRFWAFSCAYYDRKDIKEACLALQDQYQFNVNVLLLCCYIQTQDLALDAKHIEQCLVAIASTNDQLNELRKIRRKVKVHNNDAYQCLLDAELAIEKQQQQTLIDVVNDQNLLPLRNTLNIIAYAQYLELEKNLDVQSLLNMLI